jgi:ketosteroid isomerase-like protein
MTSLDSPIAPVTGQARSPRDIVGAYLDAFYNGAFDRARRLLADELVFTGPFVQVTGADAFLVSAEGLRAIVRGHRTIKQISDGDQVSTLYEMHLETPAGSGSVRVNEWNTVHDGTITQADLVFDTSAFHKLVPHAGADTQ